MGLEERQPVDEPGRNQVEGGFAGRLVKTRGRRERNEPDVDDDDPEQRDQPRAVGDQRVRRG